MANEDEIRRRRREREEEDETEASAKGGKSKEIPRAGVNDSAKMDALINQSSAQLDQITTLYNQYLAGIEKLPPLQLRQQLEETVQILVKSHKSTQAAQFRFNTFFARYQTYRDRWDRIIRDLESGKIQRVKGPAHR